MFCPFSLPGRKMALVHRFTLPISAAASTHSHYVQQVCESLSYRAVSVRSCVHRGFPVCLFPERSWQRSSVCARSTRQRVRPARGRAPATPLCWPSCACSGKGRFVGGGLAVFPAVFTQHKCSSFTLKPLFHKQVCPPVPQICCIACHSHLAAERLCYPAAQRESAVRQMAVTDCRFCSNPTQKSLPLSLRRSPDLSAEKSSSAVTSRPACVPPPPPQQQELR